MVHHTCNCNYKFASVQRIGSSTMKKKFEMESLFPIFNNGRPDIEIETSDVIASLIADSVQCYKFPFKLGAA